MTRPKRTKELHEAKAVAKGRARTASPALLRNHKTACQLLSRSDSEITSESDVRESLLRIGWPTLPPLPVRSFDAFPKMRPPILPNKDAHIQKVESTLRAGCIEFEDVDIIFGVPKSDLVSPGPGDRRGEAKLPEHEYLYHAHNLGSQHTQRHPWAPDQISEPPTQTSRLQSLQRSPSHGSPQLSRLTIISFWLTNRSHLSIA